MNRNQKVANGKVKEKQCECKATFLNAKLSLTSVCAQRWPHIHMRPAFTFVLLYRNIRLLLKQPQQQRMQLLIFTFQQTWTRRLNRRLESCRV